MKKGTFVQRKTHTRSAKKTQMIVDPPLRTHSRSGYVPTVSHDVNAEQAAFDARGSNGSQRSPSVTDIMRKSLPRRSSSPRSSPPPTEFMHKGGIDGDGLAAALAEREEEERAEQDQATREAQERYEREVLAPRRERRAQQGLDENEDMTIEEDSEPFEIEDDPVPTVPAQRTQSRSSLIANAHAQRQNRARQTEPSASTRPTRSLDVVAREVTDDDVDHLWDWLREEKRSVNGTFFARQFKTSRQLAEFVAEHVFNGTPIRSIDVNSVHVGFFALAPIDTANAAALLHVYIAPRARGSFGALFPYILTGARGMLPATMSLLFDSAGENPNVIARLLEPFGFSPRTIYVQLGTGRTDHEGV